MIYLDNAATTKMTEGSLRVLKEANEERWFNASALYKEASEESRRIREAREALSAALRAGGGELYFLSGGTEADNTALLCTRKPKGSRVIVGEGEHDAVINPAKLLKEQGFDVVFALIKPDGGVDEEKFAELLTPDVSLVSVMHVSNETGAVNVERYSRSSFTDPLSISVWDETCFGGKELSQYIYCLPNVPSYIVLSPGSVSNSTYSVEPEARRLDFGSNTIDKIASRLYYFSPGVTMNYVISWQNIDKVTLYDADGNELPASFMGVYGETYYVVVEGAGENATLDIAYADMATYDMTSPITGVMGDDGFVCARFVAPESCKYNFIDSGIYKVACVENNYERVAWEEFDAGQEIIFKLYGTPGEEYSFELEIDYLPINIGYPHNVYEGMYSFEITDAGNYEIYAYSNLPENISVTLITPEGEEIPVAATGGTLLREFVPGTYIVKVVGSGSATVKISRAETV